MKFITKFLATAAATSAIAFAGPSWAQQQTTPAPVPHTQQAITQDGETDASSGPALWKVVDEDTTVYLFGTVHALPADLEWLNDDISAALASSQSLVTEITMDDSVTAEMQQLVMSKGMLPEDTPLRSLLNEEQRAAYEAAMTKLGLPAEGFDRFEPWYASMLLAMLPLIQQGYSPDSGVEKVLLAEAGTMRRSSLETLNFQISLFDELPQESQIAFLTETAGNVDKIKIQLDAMVAEWIEGDADGLAKLMNEGLTDKVLAENLLYMRNRNWANWIKGRMEAPGTVFIAVGAGHLAGEESVQDALVELGMEAIRVR
jgi:uncharacterized protein YbaP (TraB family)